MPGVASKVWLGGQSQQTLSPGEEIETDKPKVVASQTRTDACTRIVAGASSLLRPQSLNLCQETLHVAVHFEFLEGLPLYFDLNANQRLSKKIDGLQYL